MSYDTKREAQEAVKAVRKKFPALQGKKGWTSHIWENIGWHISFHFGKRINLYYDEPSFSALIGYEHAGDPVLDTDARSRNPMDVMRKAIITIIAARNRYQSILDQAKRSLGK